MIYFQCKVCMRQVRRSAHYFHATKYARCCRLEREQQ